MLEFRSGISSAVNSSAALKECVSNAYGDGDPGACRVLVIHTTVGHNFPQMLAAAKEACPNAEVVGCTGSGVIGREGVNESMRAMAVMAIDGDECAVAIGDGLAGSNSESIGKETAGALKEKQDGINMIYVLSAGLDIAGDKIIAGIQNVFGPEIPIFGGAAADNGKAKRTFQFHGDEVMEQGLIVVGLADSSLEVLMGAHHGSVPLEGMTFEVTKSNANQVIELDGKPAWPALLERVGLPPESDPSETLPITGLGEDLDGEERDAYHNPQLLRVPIKVSDDRQSFYLPASVEEGTKYVLVQRDEQYIFDGLDQLMGRLKEELDGHRPIAVFHADCMARGRLMFNRVLKDEIIAKMQYPLCGDEVVPWLGLYGYSEYCQIAGKNRFHSYTTALFPIIRRDAA